MTKLHPLIAIPALTIGLSGQALAEFSIDGNIELNTDVIDKQVSDRTYQQGGRVEVNVHGFQELKDGYFVRGKASGIFAKDGGASTDDMWVQFGSGLWDLQAGRFEATNLFPLGKDVLVVNAGDGSAAPYFANLVRGRAGDDGGQLALHINPSDAFRFELATIFGDVDGDDTTAFAGVRPALTFQGEGFSVTAGYETIEFDKAGGSREEKEGYALTGSFNVAGVSVNLSAAQSDDKTTNNEVTSYGANLIAGPFGLGVIQSETDLASGAADPELTTLYAAYTLPLMGLDNASVSFGLSHSTSDNAGADDQVTAGRLRLNYAF